MARHSTQILVMTRLQITVLGDLKIRLAGSDAPPSFATRKNRALVAYLAMSPGMSRSREHHTPEVFFGPVTGRILDANPGVQGHLNYFAFLAATSALGIVMTVTQIWLKKRQRVRHAELWTMSQTATGA